MSGRILDGLGHFAIGLAIAIVVAGLGAGLIVGLEIDRRAIVTMPALGGVVGAWDIYLREVTQEQAKRHGYDIRRGWSPFEWTPGKNVETWLGVVPTLATGFGVTALVWWTL